MCYLYDTPVDAVRVDYVRVGNPPTPVVGVLTTATVHECPICHGETEIVDTRPSVSDIRYRTCPTCKGKGFVVV